MSHVIKCGRADTTSPQAALQVVVSLSGQRRPLDSESVFVLASALVHIPKILEQMCWTTAIVIPSQHERWEPLCRFVCVCLIGADLLAGWAESRVAVYRSAAVWVLLRWKLTPELSARPLTLISSSTGYTAKKTCATPRHRRPNLLLSFRERSEVDLYKCNPLNCRVICYVRHRVRPE